VQAYGQPGPPSRLPRPWQLPSWSEKPTVPFMKLFTTAVLLLLCLLTAPLAFGQQTPGFQDTDVEKSSQTNFKFLSLSLDPRASAMGGALTAQDDASSIAMFYNPSAMAYMTGVVHAAAMQTQWIADIRYNAASISVSPRDGRYGVFGLSVVAVDYGDFEGTVRDASAPSGYFDTGTFSPSALAVGLGYARALSDRFAIGGNVKYAYQDLTSSFVDGTPGGELTSDDYSAGTVAFDFGVLYKTGFRSLNFAMSVRNFSRELQYEQESYELPLTFQIGVSMDLVDLTTLNPSMHSIKLAVDANRPRDFAEQIKVGGEYVFMNTLALRAGYTFPTDVEGINLGVGLQHSFGTFGVGFNYAYTSFDVFDAVHRLGVQLSL
jgi:hypothetical protein